MGRQGPETHYKTCKVPKGEWRIIAKKSLWARNTSVRSHFETQVKAPGNKCAVLRDTRSNDYVGFLGMYLSEIRLEEKYVVMVQIGYVYLDKSVRGFGLSRLLAEWADRKFARWSEQHRSAGGELPVHIHSQSQCLSPAGKHVVERLDRALKARASECGYSFKASHTHDY